MTTDAARSILESMLDGIHPITGEALPADHLCNSPEVIRALHIALMGLSPRQSPPAAAPVTKRGTLNAGRPWTRDDVNQLTSLFCAGASMQEMTQKLQRRRRGIEHQISLLGLTAPRQPSSPAAGHEHDRWTEDEDNQLVYMCMQKFPIKTMADQLNRSEYAVFCHMKKLQLYGDTEGYPQKGSPPIDNSPSWTNKDTHTLRDMFKSGKSIEELAEYFQRSEENISARLYYLHLIKDSPLPEPLTARKPAKNQ